MILNYDLSEVDTETINSNDFSDYDIEEMLEWMPEEIGDEPELRDSYFL